MSLHWCRDESWSEGRWWPTLIYESREALENADLDFEDCSHNIQDDDLLVYFLALNRVEVMFVFSQYSTLSVTTSFPLYIIYFQVD